MHLKFLVGSSLGVKNEVSYDDFQNFKTTCCKKSINTIYKLNNYDFRTQDMFSERVNVQAGRYIFL